MAIELRKPIDCDLHFFIFLSSACLTEINCLLFSLIIIVGLIFKFGLWVSVQALMGFKALVSNPRNVLENWDGNSDDPCNWAMVTCFSTGLVISL